MMKHTQTLEDIVGREKLRLVSDAGADVGRTVDDIVLSLPGFQSAADAAAEAEVVAALESLGWVFTDA